MKPSTCRQFWIQAPGRGEIVEADLAPLRRGEVLVRTTYSGVSRGTETLVFRGEVPPSQYSAMRAPFQRGDFPGPVQYGYASVGQVVEDAAANDLVGRTVFCLYPHQDRYCVPAGDVTPLPEGVPPERAILAAYMETAVTVAWDARPAVGDRIVVIGAGALGLLTAWLCRAVPGAGVTIVDIDPERASVAEALGIPFAVDAPRRGEVDIAIHASGRADGLRSAMAAAGTEGTVVEASWHGDHDVPLRLGEDFHARRLTLRSSQVSRIPPDHAPRWTRERRMRLALELLRAPELDALISGECEFSELPALLPRLADDPHAGSCLRIRYDAGG